MRDQLCAKYGMPDSTIVLYCPGGYLTLKWSPGFRAYQAYREGRCVGNHEGWTLVNLAETPGDSLCSPPHGVRGRVA